MKEKLQQVGLRRVSTFLGFSSRKLVLRVPRICSIGVVRHADTEMTGMGEEVPILTAP